MKCVGTLPQKQCSGNDVAAKFELSAWCLEIVLHSLEKSPVGRVGQGKGLQGDRILRKRGWEFKAA